jgi:ferric-dicitrate binding protein FerR (iron transport regulator)
VTSGADLRGGSMLRTGRNSGAGLAIDQLSLRVGEDSEIGLVDPTQIRLVRGTVYVDMEPGAANRLVVETALGKAIHQGTQFQLEYDRSRVLLLVREGRVVFDRGTGPIVTAAGESLVIPSSGEVTRSPIAPFDPSWQWTEALAPMPDIEGKRAAELLAWVARQTGRELQYVSRAAERRAGTVILHGSLRQLTPQEALSVTLATTDLEADVQEEGRILVSLQ